MFVCVLCMLYIFNESKAIEKEMKTKASENANFALYKTQKKKFTVMNLIFMLFNLFCMLLLSILFYSLSLYFALSLLLLSAQLQYYHKLYTINITHRTLKYNLMCIISLRNEKKRKKELTDIQLRRYDAVDRNSTRSESNKSKTATQTFDTTVKRN